MNISEWEILRFTIKSSLDWKRSAICCNESRVASNDVTQLDSLWSYMTYLKYGFSLSVRSRNASFARSASSSTTVTSRLLFSLRRITYSVMADTMVMQ